MLIELNGQINSSITPSKRAYMAERTTMLTVDSLSPARSIPFPFPSTSCPFGGADSFEREREAIYFRETVSEWVRLYNCFRTQLNCLLEALCVQCRAGLEWWQKTKNASIINYLAKAQPRLSKMMLQIIIIVRYAIKTQLGSFLNFSPSQSYYFELLLLLLNWAELKRTRELNWIQLNWTELNIIFYLRRSKLSYFFPPSNLSCVL